MDRRDVAIFAGIEREKLERTVLPPNIGALFDAAAARVPDRPLWVSADGGETLTYAEFGRKVEACIGALAGLGIGKGTHVGTMMPNVPALAVTWIALAKLGAVMLPVNTGYTARELRGIVESGRIAFLVVDGAYAERLADDEGPILPADRIIRHGAAGPDGLDWSELVAASPGAPARLAEIGPDDLMTIQFTSGSTGLPKGCMLPHSYWTTIAYVRSWQGPKVERMLVDMPFHYMGGQWRFLMAVVLGATVVVALRPTMRQMVERLVAHDIDFCSVSPLLAKQAQDPRAGRLALKWAGTMALPGEIHADLQGRLNGAPVREMYGLTETGAALAMPIYADCMVGSGMIGLPVPFRRCRIVDADGADVPRGEVGELWISGPGMMTGYFERPDATAAAWSGEWFRTGDLFRQDEDGFYRIVGRIKDVIRRSGENISATELEYVVSAMSGVGDVAAVPVPDAARGEEVKLFIVPSDGVAAEAIPPAAIRAFCEPRLAAFKLPRYISYVDALPKTASGKTAKHLLVKNDPAARSYDLVEGHWR